MKASIKSLTPVALIATSLLPFTAAEDVLYSKRSLNKRGLDEDGNYNICT